MSLSVRGRLLRIFAIAAVAAVAGAALPPLPGEAYVGKVKVGGLYGGDVEDIAVSPHDPQSLLAATTEGMFRTVTSGERWLPASTGLRSVHVLGVAFDVDHPLIAYAATTAGVFRSVDGGASWTLSYSTSNPPVYDNADQVVSTVGTVYATTTRALLASKDAGLTWSIVNDGWHRDGYGAGIALGASRSRPDVLYLARPGKDWEPEVWRTDDAGLTWETLPIDDVSQIVVHPEDERIVYARRGGSVWVTRDRGESWTQLWDYNQGPVAEITLGRGDVVVISGLTFNRGGFVAFSEDAGATWTTTSVMGGTGAVYDALELDPQNERIVYHGRRGTGVHRSTDGAATFTWRGAGLTAQPVRGIASDPTNPLRMYATLGEGGLFRSDDGGTSWVDVTAGLHNPANPHRLINITTVAVSADGAVYVARMADGAFAPSLWVSTDGAETWTSRSDELPLNRNVNFLLAHPTLPGQLVVTSWSPSDSPDRYGSAFRTADGGQTWSEITALDKAVTGATVEAGTGRLLVATGGRGEEKSLAESRDFGSTWRTLTNPFSYDILYGLASDPRTGRMYAGGESPHIAHSDDGGMSWTSQYIPLMGHPERINVIAVDPLDPTQVFAGTQSKGLWFSRDRGMTWVPTSPGVQGQSVYAVMFPFAPLASATTTSAEPTPSPYVRHRAAYVGSANDTRSGLARMLPRPHNRIRPTIIGTPKVGEVLRCNPRRWSRATGYRYRWLRNGEPIWRATATTYEVRPRDRGERLRCRVTALGPGGRDVTVSWRRQVD